MTKQQKEKFDNLYDFSNNIMYNEIPMQFKENDEKENRKRKKEQEKRIKQRKKQKKDIFDLENETVIGMTNRNNQKIRQEEQKEKSKKQEKNIKRNKRRKTLVKFLLLLVLTIGGIVFALVSPIFNIRDIEVEGNVQIPKETIVSLSQIQEGQNIFKFYKNKVQNSIKSNSYVDNVKIKRKLPYTVEITIKERENTFNVEFLNGYIYINNQGYILQISEQKLDLPVIQGISTEQEQVVEGNRLNEQDLNRLEVVLQIMSICKDYELDKKISKINIADKNNYILEMEEEGKIVYLGDETNLSNKMLYVTTILEKNKDKEGTIYVNGDINNNFKPRFREKVEL